MMAFPCMLMEAARRAGILLLRWISLVPPPLVFIADIKIFVHVRNIADIKRAIDQALIFA
jgi:hypothetical protein